MKEKILKMLEVYKQWSKEHPVKNVFVVGVLFGFLIGAIFF
jgi:hypothetical protein